MNLQKKTCFIYRAFTVRRKWGTSTGPSSSLTAKQQGVQFDSL
jgi:hypothetical protein